VDAVNAHPELFVHLAQRYFISLVMLACLVVKVCLDVLSA
jgi:hypothetical protein